MPIDPSIALGIKAPTIETPDFGTSLANAYKLKTAQYEMAKTQNQLVANKLSTAKDQASYDSAKQDLIASGDPKLAEIVQRAPEVYDPTFVQNALMSTLDTKDRLDLAIKQHTQTMDDAKFGEEQRHNRATEANGASLFGKSLEGKAYNVLLNGDPNSPEYALAYNAATQPKMQPVVQPDGSTQLVAVTPNLPSNIRSPGSSGPVAPNPQLIVGQSGLMPPASTGARGINDPTPSTPTNQLLAPPSSMPSPSSPVRSFSVEPVAGTQGAPKLTDDQTKAAGFTDRTVAAHNIINQLSGSGYIPSVATDTLGESKIGNAALTEQGQQFVQAKRDFVNAVLRHESGAAISESEFANANKQYFPQPGDKPAVLAQKKANRELAIDSLKRSAGPALRGNNASSPAAPDVVAQAPHLATPQAEAIKAQYQAGKITKDQAKSALQALGSQ